MIGGESNLYFLLEIHENGVTLQYIRNVGRYGIRTQKEKGTTEYLRPQSITTSENNRHVQYVECMYKQAFHAVVGSMCAGKKNNQQLRHVVQQGWFST